MSRLRDNIESARRDYQAQRYPGNLVADIAQARRGANSMRLVIGRSPGAIAAIAAVVAIAVIGWNALSNHSARLNEPMVAVNPPGNASDAPKSEMSVGVSLASVSVPSWSDVSLPSMAESQAQTSDSIDSSTTTASAEASADMVPSFPSLDDLNSSSSSSTTSTSANSTNSVEFLNTEENR